MLMKLLASGGFPIFLDFLAITLYSRCLFSVVVRMNGANLTPCIGRLQSTTVLEHPIAGNSIREADIKIQGGVFSDAGKYKLLFYLTF
ncbi:Uncharacterized protein HZ326_5380 [Fusarium oxysporum f. sp. albedinis]|nr:Uncharacterized protein HZ326_5380 [Fusarium oxysporum f. sp. albedinis]